MTYSRFSDEELAVCRQTDLVRVCESLGYKVKKEGHVHTIQGMDSLKIFNRKTFTRFSTGMSGTSIDFLVGIQNMEWKAAVEWLLDFNGMPHLAQQVDLNDEFSTHHKFNWYKVILQADGKCEFVEDCRTWQAVQEEDIREPFVLPNASISNDRIRDYLCKERCISPEVVDFFISQKMIYESVGTHNVVFVGRDREQLARHASLRGTYQLPGKKAFKGSVSGSDTRYTFNYINPCSTKLVVCEAPIDCMSHMDLYGDLSSQTGPSNYLALTGTHDRSLERFLTENEHIREIVLALDADEPGQAASRKIAIKYSSGEWKDRAFQIEICPPSEFKDYNEELCNLRRKQEISL